MYTEGDVKSEMLGFCCEWLAFVGVLDMGEEGVSSYSPLGVVAMLWMDRYWIVNAMLCFVRR
jgi:hypothetical protein